MSATRIAAIFRVPANRSRPPYPFSAGRCVSPGPRRRGSRRGGGRRSLFGDSGLAQALENGLELGQIRRVVAPCSPGGAGAGDGEGRVEREAGLERGMRFVPSIKLRESGGQRKICRRQFSVGLDRPSAPGDRFLPTSEVALRHAHGMHPGVSHRIAWTEAQGLGGASQRCAGYGKDSAKEGSPTMATTILSDESLLAFFQS